MPNIWQPHPKQHEALIRPEYEVMFGGSRGGGKTDTGLVWLVGEEFEPGKNLLMHPRYRALVIRKNADDLADWIDRAHRFYAGFGVDIAYKPAVLRFPSGAVIRTGHLKDDQSYTKYQGQEFPRMLIEELTQIPQEKRYLQLIASCRSSIPELRPQVFMTTNPGGVGHGWVKKRFVDPMTPGNPFKDKTSGRSRIFIPARVDDNPTLMKVDPDYVRGLDALKDTDEELYKAWRLGDWNTFAGQFFREWSRDKHVIPAFQPNYNGFEVAFIGGLDWGRTAPFATILAMVKREVYEGVKFLRVYVFNECYGTDRLPREWAEEISKKIPLEHLRWIQADNQIFVPGNDKSISIGDQFIDYHPKFREILKAGSKDRIGGWANVHNWLSLAPDGKPYMLVGDNCVNLIREIPDLIHDELKVEDVNSDASDHATDALRYMLKGLKWIDAKAEMVKHTTMIQSSNYLKPATGVMNADDFAVTRR